MEVLVSIFAILATVFLLLAAWGLVHQAYLNLKVRNTDAISPARYIGTLLANVVWVLIALDAPEINLPLLLGCGAMMIGSSIVLLQVYKYPPKRSQGLLIIVGASIAASFCIAAYYGTNRTLLFPLAKPLGVVGVVASFFMIHLGTLDQYRLNKKRQSVENLSYQKEVLHLLDWGTWVIYPALLGLSTQWAPFVNACVGFVMTLLVMYQFRIYRESTAR